MKKIATIYLFISLIIMNLVFNIQISDLTMYLLISLLSIFSANLLSFTWLGLLLPIFYEHSCQPYLFYAITGIILYIVPLIQDGNFKETVSKDFLKYTFPFYLLISLIVYFNLPIETNLFFYYLFMVLMFTTANNLVSFIIFGIGLIFTTNSASAMIFYLIGYLLTFLDEQIKNHFYMKKSNISYENVVQSNSSVNTENKTKTLTELINELSMLKSNISDKHVRLGIDEVMQVCEKIKQNIDSNNEHKVNKLINYYTPELINIIKDYIDIEKVDVVSEKNLMFRVNVMRIIDKSKVAFDKILQSILNTTIHKSNIDIKVLEKILKDENLL